MISDSLLDPVPPGAPLSLVGAAGQNFPTRWIDILGSGIGTPPINIIGNVAANFFGQDSGIYPLKLLFNMPLSISCVTANAATLNAQFEAAPDTGAAGGYQPGTVGVFAETSPYAAAALVAGEVIRLDFPVAWPASFNPRFWRINFAVPAGTNFTAGAIGSVKLVTGRDDYSIKYAQSNYTV